MTFGMYSVYYIPILFIFNFFSIIICHLFQKPIGGIAVLPTGSFNFMRKKKDKDVPQVSK